jgi:hypothetical protein
MSEHTVAEERRLTIMETALERLTEITSDHEKRLRKLDRVIGYGSGAIGMALFLGKVFKII